MTEMAKKMIDTERYRKPLSPSPTIDQVARADALLRYALVTGHTSLEIVTEVGFSVSQYEVDRKLSDRYFREMYAYRSLPPAIEEVSK